MNFFKGLSFALAVCSALLLVPSCGGSSTSDGTDSNTHWLEDCVEDSDCGSLSCVCGVCSRPCEVTSDCRGLSADAVCEVPSSCGKVATSACVAGGGGGGNSSTGGGSSAEAGTSQTLPDPECPPMDAQSATLSCGTVVGYAFDGKVCAPVHCRCDGTECHALYETADECDSAYKSCYAKYGVQRSCTTNFDCALRERTCCPECFEQSVASYIGATRSSAFPEDSGLCVGDPNPDRECGKCTPVPNPALYSLCVEGECRPIDMSEQASCQTAADCKLVGTTCCDCTGGPGMSLNVDVTSLPYCPDDCAVCEYENSKQYASTCDPDVGKCRMVTTTF